ncbi:MAG: dockerin type I domain-containing protein [Candidatus Zixiibacteriota bacterium]
MRICGAVLCVVVCLVSGGFAPLAAGPIVPLSEAEEALIQEAAIDSSVPSYRIQGNPHLRTTVTNWGYFGNKSGELVDSATGDEAPGFESPAHSHLDYLYEGSLWVGGVVNGDTLVSTGSIEWPPTFELHPDGVSEPVPSDRLGDEEYTSVYSDMVTDPALVREDATDGPHQPLPVSVRQTTYSVDDPKYNKGILLEVVITNEGSSIIHDLWLGWYVDCDVRHPLESGSWLGDLSGYRESSITLDGEDCDIRAAWTADNSGDPDTVNWVFDSTSPTGVFGAMVLECEPPLPLQSFNWWITAFTKPYDWGPSRDAADTTAIGGYGRTLGDAVRYRRMSNQETDYDQMYAAIDMTAEGWIPPTTASIAANIADGYDARFLLTRGVVDLAPGDSITTVWAWVVAPGFHTVPDHFITTFDPQDPSMYRAGLNFTVLDTALARMKMLWESEFALATVGPPRGFHISGWDDSTAWMEWLPRSTERMTGFQVYRSYDSTVFGGLPVGFPATSATSFVHDDLNPLPTHYYVIRSRDNLGRLGVPTPVVDVLPDRPYSPVPTGADRGDGHIRLRWELAEEPDVIGHRAYRREQGDSIWAYLGQTAMPQQFTDNGAINAQPYEYLLTAVSALGSESFPSDTITGVAFAFGGPPLVIDHTLSGPTALTIKDSVVAVWQRITQPFGADFRDANPLTTPAFGLDVYDPCPAVIVVTDSRQSFRPGTLPQLDLYGDAGGVIILAGRDVFNTDVIAEGTIEFEPGDLAFDQYGITAAYYPRVLLSHPTRPNAEFVGARSLDPELPDLIVDPARTGWGLNPQLPPTDGAVPFVGFFEIDTSRAEAVYAYVSRDSLTSPSHGKVVGIISKVPGVHAAVLSFPVSYMQENESSTAIQRLLVRLGWVGDLAGDLNGDGFVAANDLALLIDYLFRNDALSNVNNADVNGDCRVNLVDLVIAINYVFLGGPALGVGCGG